MKTVLAIIGAILVIALLISLGPVLVAAGATVIVILWPIFLVIAIIAIIIKCFKK